MGPALSLQPSAFLLDKHPQHNPHIMSTVVSVWSKVIQPGEDVLITEDVALQITNITLEVDEASTSTKRSVLKMQHLEAAPELLRAASGYDLASDSEYDDDSEIDSDEFDDEEEDDEEMEADTSKVSKASTSSKANGKATAAAATAAAAAAEEDDEEDDEEEDSDDDEEDFDFDREEQEVQICSLLPGKLEHFTTNLILPGGEDFVFKLSGEHKVHLFGHYLIQPSPSQFDEPPSDYDSDEEYDSDEMSESELGMYDPETGLLLEDDEDDEENSKIMEIEEETVSKPPKKAAAAAAAAPAAEATADKSKLSKNQLKKLAKKEADAAKVEAPASKAAAAAPAKKEEAATAKPAAAATAAKKAPSKKQTLPSGLVIEDNKVGSGPAATSGKRLQMRYIGRLQNGKIFDQNTKGAPFSFKLGKGEVIKGWDEGLAGMQVGGERRLVIPANLAYGKQAIAGIPANSTLTFEVKLLAIK